MDISSREDSLNTLLCIYVDGRNIGSTGTTYRTEGPLLGFSSEKKCVTSLNRTTLAWEKKERTLHKVDRYLEMTLFRTGRVTDLHDQHNVPSHMEMHGTPRRIQNKEDESRIASNSLDSEQNSVFPFQTISPTNIRIHCSSNSLVYLLIVMGPAPRHRDLVCPTHWPSNRLRVWFLRPSMLR